MAAVEVSEAEKLDTIEKFWAWRGVSHPQRRTDSYRTRLQDIDRLRDDLADKAALEEDDA